MDRYEKMLQEIRGEVEVVDALYAERRAKHFLATLDADSAEGMWFEALADGFATRLEAALVYVRDVKQRP